jgi:uncharacterized membrane protein YhdT
MLPACLLCLKVYKGDVARGILPSCTHMLVTCNLLMVPHGWCVQAYTEDVARGILPSCTHMLVTCNLLMVPHGWCVQAYTEDVARGILPSWTAIAQRRRAQQFTEEQRNWQLLR